MQLSHCGPSEGVGPKNSIIANVTKRRVSGDCAFGDWKLVVAMQAGYIFGMGSLCMFLSFFYRVACAFIRHAIFSFLVGGGRRTPVAVEVTRQDKLGNKKAKRQEKAFSRR